MEMSLWERWTISAKAERLMVYGQEEKNICNLSQFTLMPPSHCFGRFIITLLPSCAALPDPFSISHLKLSPLLPAIYMSLLP